MNEPANAKNTGNFRNLVGQKPYPKIPKTNVLIHLKYEN